MAKGNRYKFKRRCPLSAKGAPVVDYKNISLLKKYDVKYILGLCDEEESKWHEELENYFLLSSSFL